MLLSDYYQLQPLIMKNLVFSLLAVFSLSLSIASCGNKAKSSTNAETTEVVVDKTGKEYTSAYVCPMHCKKSGSDKAGECPVCKMDYVVNKKHKNNAHNHESHNHGNHDGHDHGNHEGHNHGDHEGHDHGSHEGHNH